MAQVREEWRGETGRFVELREEEKKVESAN